MIPQDIKWLVVKNCRKDPVMDFVDEMVGIDDLNDPEMPKSFDSLVGRASYHHALAYNKVCRSGKLVSRFVLFMDPDFFIIPPLDKCIEYMLLNKLDFFGAPYLIQRGKNRIQDFPVAFCMFVDTTKVDISKFDFMPGESSSIMQDTGYKIYKEALNDSSIKYKAVLPPKPDFDTIYPSSKHSLSSVYGIAPQIPVDQYFWQDQLFGLHCHMKLHLRDSDEVFRRTKIQTKEVRKIVEIVRNQHDQSV